VGADHGDPEVEQNSPAKTSARTMLLDLMGDGVMPNAAISPEGVRRRPAPKP